MKDSISCILDCRAVTRNPNTIYTLQDDIYVNNELTMYKNQHSDLKIMMKTSKKQICGLIVLYANSVISSSKR